MTRISQDLTRKPLWMLSAMFLLLPMGNVGCSFATDQVLPAQLESRVSSNATADDHLAAALLYQEQAQLAKTEAGKYEQAAASIRAIEDPKGFRRGALMTAAQEHRRTADEMQQLYASHEAKAQTMMGKQQAQ
ncbi:MAG TPA: hypothetical protein VLD60_04800 [Nitrospira sp.]|nr:hypothetical protein [Nitrospira sp.]